MTKNKKMARAILETAKDMMQGDILDKKTYNKITMRHIDKDKLPKIRQMSPEEIRELRENVHLSQAAFACYLNLTVGYISQLERGTKHPTGATLALLNAIRRKGFEAVF